MVGWEIRVVANFQQMQRRTYYKYVRIDAWKQSSQSIHPCHTRCKPHRKQIGREHNASVSWPGRFKRTKHIRFFSFNFLFCCCCSPRFLIFDGCTHETWINEVGNPQRHCFAFGSRCVRIVRRAELVGYVLRRAMFIVIGQESQSVIQHRPDTSIYM